MTAQVWVADVLKDEEEEKKRKKGKKQGIHEEVVELWSAR